MRTHTYMMNTVPFVQWTEEGVFSTLSKINNTSCSNPLIQDLSSGKGKPWICNSSFPQPSLVQSSASPITHVLNGIPPPPPTKSKAANTQVLTQQCSEWKRSSKGTSCAGIAYYWTLKLSCSRQEQGSLIWVSLLAEKLQGKHRQIQWSGSVQDLDYRQSKLTPARPEHNLKRSRARLEEVERPGLWNHQKSRHDWMDTIFYHHDLEFVWKSHNLFS